KAARDADHATKDLTASIEALAEAADPRSLLGAAWQAEFERAFAQFDNLGEKIDELDRKLSDARQRRLGVTSIEDMERLDAEIRALEQQIAQVEHLIAVFGDAAAAEREQAETLAALNTVLNATGPAADAARQAVSNYAALLKNDQITVVEFMAAVQEIANNLPAHNMAVLEFNEALRDTGDA